MKIDGTEVMENAAWASVAYSAAKKIIANKYRSNAFLAESLYKDLVKKVGEPYDARTMGRVIKALSQDRCIRRNGYYAGAKSSNGSAKPIWQKVPRWGRP